MSCSCRKVSYCVVKDKDTALVPVQWHPLTIIFVVSRCDGREIGLHLVDCKIIRFADTFVYHNHAIMQKDILTIPPQWGS